MFFTLYYNNVRETPVNWMMFIQCLLQTVFIINNDVYYKQQHVISQ